MPDRFVQHGRNPSWQAYPHDVPIAALLAYVAAEAASDRFGRGPSPRWWPSFHS
ncbi:hypothetical protein GFS60_01334 [Rhodococcus sp. WAY2]|nr:hypothetical protein GFS60_01334 [Rhodococcus sp. WAY2]